MSGAHDACCTVQCCAEIVAVPNLRYAGVQAHPYSHREWESGIGCRQSARRCLGIRGLKRALCREARGERIRSSAEDGDYAVASGLDDMSVRGFDCLTQRFIVARECGAHRGRILVPQRRAAFDIREQEGHGARGGQRRRARFCEHKGMSGRWRPTAQFCGVPLVFATAMPSYSDARPAYTACDLMTSVLAIK